MAEGRVPDRCAILFHDPAIVEPSGIVQLPPMAELLFVRGLIGRTLGLERDDPREVIQRRRAEGESAAAQGFTREGLYGEHAPKSRDR
jgi:hypothetical protein